MKKEKARLAHVPHDSKIRFAFETMLFNSEGMTKNAKKGTKFEEPTFWVIVSCTKLDIEHKRQGSFFMCIDFLGLWWA